MNKKTAQVEAQQATIDRLMLEHAPDEMAKEQVKMWGEHQRAVNADLAERIRQAVALADTTTPESK